MNGKDPVGAAIEDYHAGLFSVPLPRGDKAPRSIGWQTLRLVPAELRRRFARPANRGRLLGIPGPTEQGGFIVCVDLDTPEAVALASSVLPRTGEIGGRRGSPISHWFYRSEPPPRTRRFNDPDGTRLLELLSTGTQVVVPISIHPSGEPYSWQRRDPPATISADRLVSACKRLAAATLLCRCWPQVGTRQDTALALAGALLRAGWTPEEAQAFIAAIARVARDEEATKRAASVAATAGRRAKGDGFTGWPTLSRLIGEPVADCIGPWLGISDAASQPPLLPGPTTSAGVETGPLADAAYQGLAGDVVRTLGPHTEAHAAALLFQFLIAFGNAVGNGPGFAVEASLHRANLFCVLVGSSSKARKGTSWQHVLRLFRLAEEPASPRLTPWLASSIKDGLSTGEGLIWHVRDEVREWKSHAKGAREVVTDGGVRDKRLLIQSSEFVSPIRCMSRNGNTLSPVLRSAWDCGDLRILTRNQPVTATAAHVSIIGHITAQELREGLTDIELANGFANRFLWVFVKRSKLLPDGGSLSDSELAPLARRLRAALESATAPQVLARDEEATKLWRHVYPALSSERPGLTGAITARAEAQVVRLALVYALLDTSPVIREVHLQAALAAWDYVARSAMAIFGQELSGDPLADRLLAALRDHPGGLTRTDLSTFLGRHQNRGRIAAALERLESQGLTYRQKQQTGGRPVERWFTTRRS